MEPRTPSASTLLGDVAACVGFYTRLPVPAGSDAPRSFADAQWAAPVAGLAVGLIVGGTLVLAGALGIPATIAAGLALAGGILVTGALHEDGLGDVADGFGGGRDRDGKLAIMRDSRLGSYGALALMLSVLVRWAALVALAAAGPVTIILVIMAAHAASRATIPAFMARVPPARSDGLSAGAGRPANRPALAAAALGFAALLPCGIGFALVATLLLACVLLLVERLATRQIGGQTGDVLGALQQGGELALLAAAATLLT